MIHLELRTDFLKDSYSKINDVKLFKNINNFRIVCYRQRNVNIGIEKVCMNVFTIKF